MSWWCHFCNTECQLISEWNFRKIVCNQFSLTDCSFTKIKLWIFLLLLFPIFIKIGSTMNPNLNNKAKIIHLYNTFQWFVQVVTHKIGINVKYLTPITWYCSVIVRKFTTLWFYELTDQFKQISWAIWPKIKSYLGI